MWTAVGILFSKSGGAVEKIWRGNPVIRAVVIIAVALVVLDIAARESMSLWREGLALQRDAATQQTTINATNAKNNAATDTTDFNTLFHLNGEAKKQNVAPREAQAAPPVEQQTSATEKWLTGVAVVVAVICFGGLGLVKLLERRAAGSRKKMKAEFVEAKAKFDDEARSSANKPVNQ